MTVCIIFKNGFELPINCDEFKLKTTSYGGVLSYDIKGIKDNKPLFLCFQDIECIYQKMDEGRVLPKDEITSCETCLYEERAETENPCKQCSHRFLNKWRARE